jgi:hypothetical protein
MKNIKGLSQVVSTVLLILLSIVSIAVIWGVVNSFVENRLEGANSCLEILDQVKISSDWTCYNSSSNQMLISIEINNADITSVIFGISSGEESSVFRILNESSLVERVQEYSLKATGNYSISLPSREGGKTYIFDNITEIPEKITISAQVGKKQCGTSDYLENVYICEIN